MYVHPPQTPPSSFSLDLPNTNPYLSSVLINFNISSCIFCFGLSYQPLTISLLSWRKTNKNRHRTYQCSTSSRECLNKAGDHAWRKRTQNVNRKPVTGNSIRILLVDKWKFTKSLKWKKCWTRQTTHSGHIFIRYKTKIYSLPFLHSSG